MTYTPYWSQRENSSFLQEDQDCTPEIQILGKNFKTMQAESTSPDIERLH